MNAEDLLRTYMANQAGIRNHESVNPPKCVAGIIPDNVMPLQSTERTSLEARLEKFSNVIVRPSEIPEEWKNLPNFSIPTTHEFSDTKLLNESGYFITKTTIQNLAEMGRIVIPMLCSGFTRVGVVGLFTLAYNLKDSESADWKDDIDDIPAELFIFDTTLDGAEENYCYLAAGQHKPFLATQDVVTEAAYYCYIAASVLRLFTKSPENYSKAWNHIQTNFTRFYSRSPPVIPYSPNIEVLRGLHSALNREWKYKVTLFKLLYASASNNRALDLKRFLYDLHLANTGLCVVGIFVQLCMVLDVHSQKLLDIINIEFQRQAKALAEMIRIAKTNADDHKRKMWRFGRIFDSTFMTELQTKSCSKLVYIFGVCPQVRRASWE